MKLGIISLGGDSSYMILKEAKKYFKSTTHLDIRKTEVHVGSKGDGVLYEGKPIDKYDAIYVRGSYKYEILQRSLTTALFNEAYMPIQQGAFTLAHNKFLTVLELQKNKIDIPTTYIAATTESAKKLLEKVNYPIIMKIPYGTHGKGVMFADSPSSAKSVLDTLEVFKQPYIMQEYVETGGTDIRAIVVGDKVVATMKRKAVADELRANIHMGGKGIGCELDYDTEKLAIKSAKAIGADICAVDILEGAKPVVIEINLSPGLKGITEATKKNVAGEIAEYLAEKAEEFAESKKSGSYGEIIKDLEIESKNGKTKEIITNLNIKAGIIKLPKLITDITMFDADDEVVLTVKKGKLEIKRHTIEKEDKK